MLGFLIDEEEFEVQPAVTRIFQMYEVDTQTKKRKPKKEEPIPPSTYITIYPNGVVDSTQTFEYTVNLYLANTYNVDDFSVYVNGDYYGDGLDEIQLNTNDILTISVNKTNPSEESKIEFSQTYL